MVRCGLSFLVNLVYLFLIQTYGAQIPASSVDVGITYPDSSCANVMDIKPTLSTPSSPLPLVPWTPSKVKNPVPRPAGSLQVTPTHIKSELGALTGVS